MCCYNKMKRIPRTSNAKSTDYVERINHIPPRCMTPFGENSECVAIAIRSMGMHAINCYQPETARLSTLRLCSIKTNKRNIRSQRTQSSYRVQCTLAPSHDLVSKWILRFLCIAWRDLAHSRCTHRSNHQFRYDFFRFRLPYFSSFPFHMGILRLL